MCQWTSYLLAQVFEQNLFDPLNWLAGARLAQYSHFNTGEEKTQLHLHRVKSGTLKDISGSSKKIKSDSTTYMEGHFLSVQPEQNLCL